MYWKHLNEKDKVPDLSLLPPCSRSLAKHKIRSHFVSKMWKNAITPMQGLGNFYDYCWHHDAKIVWIDMPYPLNIQLLFKETDDTELESNEEDETDTLSEYTDEDND